MVSQQQFSTYTNCVRVMNLPRFQGLHVVYLLNKNGELCVFFYYLNNLRSLVPTQHQNIANNRIGKLIESNCQYLYEHMF
ncbi:hypothetical protein FKM82_000171 [Ascaphus truei]